MRKTYGDDLNSYDALKSLAIVLTVLYHLGSYIFTGQYWLFVPGVLIPIWFFLIGYAKTREVPLFWVASGLVLMAANMVIGTFLFPVNILFLFILIRLTIDPLAAFATRSNATFIGTVILLALLALPTSLIIEYGTFGVLCALFGYIERHKIQLPSALSHFMMLVIAALGYVVLVLRMPATLPVQYHVAMVVLALAGPYGLARFRPVSWPGLKARMPLFTAFLQFCGRWSLEIYVAHVLIFMAISWFLYPEKYHFFGFEIFPFGL